MRRGKGGGAREKRRARATLAGAWGPRGRGPRAGAGGRESGHPGVEGTMRMRLRSWTQMRTLRREATRRVAEAGARAGAGRGGGVAAVDLGTSQQGGGRYVACLRLYSCNRVSDKGVRQGGYSVGMVHTYALWHLLLPFLCICLHNLAIQLLFHLSKNHILSTYCSNYISEHMMLGMKSSPCKCAKPRSQILQR